MNELAWALLALTVLLALVDSWAVAAGRRAVELICKPATLVALIAVAVTLDPTDGAVRAWFVVALVFSLAGDTFLLFDRFFVPGLVASSSTPQLAPGITSQLPSSMAAPPARPPTETPCGFWI